MKALRIGFWLSVTLLVVACHQKNHDNVLRVGVIAGPEASLMDAAKKQALKQDNLKIEVVEFTDYVMPNTALNDGSIDANVFQHLPYFRQSVAERSYPFKVFDKTFIYPMGIYSKNIKTLSAIPMNATVALPSDPTNEARALFLLQQAKLITLNPRSLFSATPKRILKNPKHLIFKELDAANLPRSLDDVTLAVVNTNYAIPAGMSIKQALFKESSHSPYANLIVVRNKDPRVKLFKALTEALHSAPVLTRAQQLFHGAAVPAWH